MNDEVIKVIVFGLIMIILIVIAIIYEIKGLKKSDKIIKRYELLLDGCYDFKRLNIINDDFRNEVTKTRYGKTIIIIHNPNKVNEILKEINTRCETLASIKDK